MSENAPTYQNVTRYNATGAWDFGTLNDYFDKPVPRVLFRDDEIVIDWPPSDGYTTHTKLTRKAGSSYHGESIWAIRTAKEMRAAVNATLYSNESSHILVGEEYWASERDWFILQLADGQTIDATESD